MSQVKHEFGGFWTQVKLERLSARDFLARFEKLRIKAATDSVTGATSSA